MNVVESLNKHEQIDAVASQPAQEAPVDEAPPAYEAVVSPAMQQLLDMGISQEDAEISLYRCNGNVEEAILFCQEFLCVDYGAMDGSVTLGGGQRPSKLKKFMRKMTTKARKSLTGPSVLFPKSSSSTSRSFGGADSGTCSTPTSAASLRRDSFQSSVISEPAVNLQRASSQESEAILEDNEAPPNYEEIFTPPAELGGEENEAPPGYDDISAEASPENDADEQQPEQGEANSEKFDDDRDPMSPVSSREASPRESFIPSMRVLAIPSAEGCADSDDEASIVSMISAYSKSSHNEDTHTPNSRISSDNEVNCELQRLGSEDEAKPSAVKEDTHSASDIDADEGKAGKVSPEVECDFEIKSELPIDERLPEVVPDIDDEELLRDLSELAAEEERSIQPADRPSLAPVALPAFGLEASDPFSPAAAAVEEEVESQLIEASYAEQHLIDASAPPMDALDDNAPSLEEHEPSIVEKEVSYIEEKNQDEEEEEAGDNDHNDSASLAGEYDPSIVEREVSCSEEKQQEEDACNNDENGSVCTGMDFDDEELLRELEILGMDMAAVEETASEVGANDNLNDAPESTPNANVSSVSVDEVAIADSFNGFAQIDENVFQGEPVVNDGFSAVPRNAFEASAPMMLEASVPPAQDGICAIEDAGGAPLAVSVDEEVDAGPAAASESPPSAAAQPSGAVTATPQPSAASSPERVVASMPVPPSSTQRPTPVMTSPASDQDDAQLRSAATTPVVAAVASTVSGENDDEEVVVADTLLHVNVDPRAHNAVAGSYLRNEQGECYVSVAMPLEDDEEGQTSTAATHQAQEEARRQEEIRQRRLQEQSRGLFGYVSTALYGADVADESMNRGRTAKRRVLLSYDVSSSNNGAWTPQITTKQVKLRNKSDGPQGSLPDVVTLPVCATQEQAHRLCEATAPPLWAGGSDKKECVICFCTEGIFNKLHHCRNCGYYVCKKCSSKSWPSTMVPTTYINKENYIRVCDSCSCLAEAFVDGLVTGDMTKTMAIFSSGNVNLYCPFSIYKSAPYPVHLAAQGGNLDILRWLLEDRMCPIKSRGVGSPLMTTEGMSVFAIAAYYGHVPIMRYVVHRHGAAVTEASEITVLHRALHAALEVCLFLCCCLMLSRPLALFLILQAVVKACYE